LINHHHQMVGDMMVAQDTLEILVGLEEAVVVPVQ
jgi:hypothetical protein